MWPLGSRRKSNRAGPSSYETIPCAISLRIRRLTMPIFRGRSSLSRRTEAGLHNALGYFHAAVDADPNYASAYVGLADCYGLMLSNYDISAEATVLQARTAANQA